MKYQNKLHNIIKESVKHVLTELDWKTYANAGSKAYDLADDMETRRERGKMRSRGNKFFKKAIDTFNKENSYQDPDFPSAQYSTYAGMGSYLSRDNKRHLRPYGMKIGYDGDITTYTNGAAYTPGSEMKVEMRPRYFFRGHPLATSAYEKADDEIDKYLSGEYQYEPNGRGWYLDDDDINESIRRNLRKLLK